MTPLGGPWPAIFHPFAQRLLGLPPGTLLVLVVWTLVWKGLALWRSARADQPVWFVVLLIVNTVGILEILYLVFFAPRRPPASTPAPPVPGGGQGAASSAPVPSGSDR